MEWEEIWAASLDEPESDVEASIEWENDPSRFIITDPGREEAWLATDIRDTMSLTESQ